MKNCDDVDGGRECVGSDVDSCGDGDACEATTAPCTLRYPPTKRQRWRRMWFSHHNSGNECSESVNEMVSPVLRSEEGAFVSCDGCAIECVPSCTPPGWNQMIFI